MTNSATERSQIAWARVAGFLYVFTYLTYGVGMAITSRLKVAGDFAETAQRIVGSELLYRFGLSCELGTSLLCVFLAIGLYMAVKPIDASLALFGLILRLAENVLGAASAVIGFAELKLYLGPDSAAAFDAKQLSVFMSLYGDARMIAFYVAMILLGMGSVFFFYLFAKSDYIPKVMSIWGLWSSVVFAATSFAFLLWPHWRQALQLGWMPMGLTEISVGLWLLIKGVNLQAQKNLLARSMKPIVRAQ